MIIFSLVRLLVRQWIRPGQRFRRKWKIEKRRQEPVHTVLNIWSPYHFIIFIIITHTLSLVLTALAEFLTSTTINFDSFFFFLKIYFCLSYLSSNPISCLFLSPYMFFWNFYEFPPFLWEFLKCALLNFWTEMQFNALCEMGGTYPISHFLAGNIESFFLIFPFFGEILKKLDFSQKIFFFQKNFL